MDPMAKQPVGVAFGGGGARGLAHIGVVKELYKRSSYLPTITAGTSAGSIVAAMYASGVSTQQMEEEIRRFDWFRQVVNFHDTLKNFFENRKPGLVSNSNLEETVNDIIDGKTFSDLQTKLAVTATDIEEGRRVIFTTPLGAETIKKNYLYRFLPPPDENKPGFETVVISDYDNIGKAVSASCAIPGLFQPVEIAGMRLADGAIVNQVPVDIVRALGAKTVIGVSLSFSVMPEHVSNLSDVFSKVIWMLGAQQIRRSLDMADIGFEITGIEQRSIFDTHQYDLIDLGELEMRRNLNMYEKKTRILSTKRR